MFFEENEGSMYISLISCENKVSVERRMKNHAHNGMSCSLDIWPEMIAIVAHLIH